MESASIEMPSVWRRFRKNKAALAGLFLIGIAVFIALFAYFLAPDPSPDANRIILEAGGSKPGYSSDFLMLRKSSEPRATSVFKRLLYGKEDF